MQLHATTSRGNRSGFTLIEMLVVLAIIAVLIGLSGAAYMQFLTAESRRVSRDALVLIDNLVMRQWKTVADKANQEPLSPSRPDAAKALTLAGGNSRRARVILMKLRLKQAFPQTFAEILVNPGPSGTATDLPSLVDYRRALQELGINAGNLNSTTQPMESAVCLLMALELGPGGRGTNASDLTPFVKTFTYTTGGSPSTTVDVRGLADGWAEPLTFCRFPTDSPALNPGGMEQDGLNDPMDPLGLLTESGWLGTYEGAFEGVLHKLPPRPMGTNPKSYNIRPLVVSSGRDRKLGLDLRNFGVTNGGENQDNLYSNEPPK